MKTEARVNWYIRGQVECPHCEWVNEFTDVDEFWTYSNIGENHEKFDEPCEMTCKGCNENIIVNGSDY